jgi:hypothetical protein
MRRNRKAERQPPKGDGAARVLATVRIAAYAVGARGGEAAVLSGRTGRRGAGGAAKVRVEAEGWERGSTEWSIAE